MIRATRHASNALALPTAYTLPHLRCILLQEKDVMKMFRAAGMGPTSYELGKYMEIMDGI